jgi:serine phosphatase RsbU (regulator of sigma subunit)
VTVIYGVLGPPNRDGARQFRWANAGHLPPLVKVLDGHTSELDGGRSGVIGAPAIEPRGQGEALLARASSLVLYTDGLVERPGTPLSDSIGELRSYVEQLPSDTSADEICEAVLVAKALEQTRDDIAVVVIRLSPARVPEASPPAGTITLTTSARSAVAQGAG